MGLFVGFAGLASAQGIVVDGVVQSTAGGFRFPDGTVQTTAVGHGLAPVAATGQAACWEGSGSPTACTGTGQDGDLQPGVAWPTPRFSTPGDGTVVDDLTGLVWLQDANCFGTRTWVDALADANGLAAGSCGLSDGSAAGDWRLPNLRELSSLVDRGVSNPALPSGHPFTDVQWDGILDYYWSSSTYPRSTGIAYALVPSNGALAIPSKATSLHVWPVRGGLADPVSAPARLQDTDIRGCWDGAGASIPCIDTGQDGEIQAGVDWAAPRFTDNGDGTVTDGLTGLVWLRLADCVETDWEGALAAANSLASGSCGLTDGSAAGDWRLPSAGELMSLIDHGPSGDLAFLLPGHPFVNVKAGTSELDLYWSSTTDVSLPVQAWAAALGFGWLSPQVKAEAFFMWPVREGVENAPAQTALSADGWIEASAAGFQFPDGSTQPTAATSRRSPLAATGQTTCWDGSGDPAACANTGQDGDQRAGVAPPSPRFTDLSNGGVLDELTGLVWLKDIDCFGERTWAQALGDANGLASGDCGLTDGSVAGDWRLPNLQELASLVDYGETDLALPLGHPFSNLPASNESTYWSSTTLTNNPSSAVTVFFYFGQMLPASKSVPYHVWPVRSAL